MKRVAPRSSRPRRWFHGLFSCCEDVPLSCQVFFCECNAIGQMYERTAKRGGACLAIASILWITFFVSQFLSDTSVALATSAVREVCVWWGVCTTVVDQGQLTASQIVGGVAGFVGIVSFVISAFAICTSRRRIRERDDIPGGNCEDCCTSSFCGCCSVVQMLRQERITGNEYRPCTSTAV